MSFWDWLVKQAQKVYDWFSGSYWSLVDRLKNLYSIVSSKVLSEIGPIKQAIINWVLSQLATLNTLINQVKGFAKDLFDTVLTKAKAWWQDALETAYNYYLKVKAEVKGWLDQGISLVKGLIDALEAEVKKNLAKILADQKPFFDKLNSIYQGTVAVLSLLYPGNLSKLAFLISQGFQLIALMVSNPIGFIFGILRSRFVEFFCWVIATALGTEKAELPPAPDFSGGITTPLNPGEGLPPVAGGDLVKPLSKLWVSGYTFDSSHPGTDFGLTTGQEVFAAHSGIVETAVWSSVGYGFTITLKGDPYWTRYAHLQGFAVAAGDRVNAGQVIGFGDSTGNSTGPHLHFELKVNGSFVDPLLYLPLG